MSESDPFRYRVKFKDIRVNPPKDEASRARAKQTRVCDEQGCDLEGAHPAPRSGGKGRHFRLILARCGGEGKGRTESAAQTHRMFMLQRQKRSITWALGRVTPARTRRISTLYCLTWAVNKTQRSTLGVCRACKSEFLT